MRSIPSARLAQFITWVATACCVPAAEASIGPPVEIKMPPDTKPAVSGQAYEGVFEVNVFKPGQVTDFLLEGEGWTIHSAEFPTEIVRSGVLRIPFRAVPSDADKPIALSLLYNGRKVRQQYSIGPAYFAQAGKPKALVRLENTSGFRQPARPASTGLGPQAATRGGAIPVHVVGRIVYNRSDGLVVGADRIDVRVLDDDGASSEEIWSGWTDENGFFDTGVVSWDDCDGLGCDDPDLVIYVDTSTTDWVDVTDNSITEDTYSWESAEVTNYGGGYYDYGWLTPLDPAEQPAIHIFNSITRARRFILENPGYSTPEVQVEWPVDEWSHYEPGPREIHIFSDHSWEESTAVHEYGHHFMHSLTHEPPPTDYDNGICDEGSPMGNCFPSGGTWPPGTGHCVWCRETDHDAWNEGWPNWLADVVLRGFPDRYSLEAMFVQNDETPIMCCVDGTMHDPLLTEGFVGALLRDIEDPNQDDHDGDGTFDLLCLGPNPNFHVLVNRQPITVTEFINGFLADYSQHTGNFFATAFNVGGSAYVGGFPSDSQPPGVVPQLDSSTHPQGIGGDAPCITFEFTPAPDDATGASKYSYRATQISSGIEPDETADPVFGADGCKLAGTAPVSDIGLWYISIKAQDNAGNWSSQWATFGPFEVTDCNATGILDVCDISCASEGIPGCQIAGLCAGQPGCGLSSDCQPNFIPDECDLAEGTSDDCNINDTPDECEPMKHWDGNDGVSCCPAGPYWHHAGNWEEGGAPATGDEVCIADGLPTPILRQNAYTIGTLACYQDFSIASAGTARLTLTEPSFILGDLSITAGRLTVEDELIVSGALTWSGGLLEGPGQTTVTGGHFINGNVAMVFHTLNLQCDTLVTAGGIAGGGSTNFTIRNFPGYTYTQSEGIVHQANSSVFINEGLILKPSGSGELRLDSPVHNSGEIRAEAGTIRFGGGLISSGSILGLPATTLQFNGSQEFTAGSSVVGDQIVFHSSSAPDSRHVRGTYDADAGTTLQSSANVTFHPEASVIDYGDRLLLDSAIGHFEAVVGSTIAFQSMDIGGTAYFTSGDPIVTETLTLGVIRGANKDITVNGLLTWNNAGSFLDSGVINANGNLIVAAGSSVKNLQSVLNNAGTATVVGSFAILSGGNGAVNNLATGSWDIQVDGDLISGSTLVFNNAGTLRKSAGTGTSTIGIGGAVRPQINNTGTVEVQTGVLAFRNSDYTQTAGQTLLDGGNLSMTGTTPGPVRILGGALTGAGTVTGNVNNVGGTVAPGLSAGQLNIVGNYTQSDGALEIELSGPTPGADHDLLAVTGTATLTGILRVELIDGFIPAIGQHFTVLTAGSVGGAFTTVESLTPGLTVNVIYNPTSVVLEIIAAPPAGDCDDDGDADLDDYAAFPTCMSGPETPYIEPQCECYDADANGSIDLHDFAGFQEDFTG